MTPAPPPPSRSTPTATTVHAAGAALALSVIVVAALTVAGPLWAARASARERSIALAEARDRSDTARAQSAAVRLRAAELKARVAKDTVTLRPLAALNEQLGVLTRLAEDAGLSLQQVVPGQTAAGARFSTVPVKATGSGTYPGLAAFFHTLHALEPTTAVTAFELRAGAAGPETAAPVAAFTLDLLWHALPARGDAGRARSAASAAGDPASEAARP